MCHFRWISVGMVIAGIVLILLTLVLPLDAFWLLGGGMLIISGVVKLVILHLWRELVQPGQASPSVSTRKR